MIQVFEETENCIDETLLKVNIHPKSKPFSGELLDDPSYQLKKGYETKWLQLIEQELKTPSNVHE